MNPNDPYSSGQQPYQPAQPQPIQQPGYGQQPVGQQPYAQQPFQPQPAAQPLYTPTPGQIGVTPPALMPPPAPHRGSKVWLILAIIFIVLTVAAAAVGVWAYMNYLDQKNNVDSKVSTAVTEAVKTQADKDAADFLQKEKQPNRHFVGPDDYSRVAFDYPKTWSVYVGKDAVTGGNFEAYFNPVTVPPVSAKQQFALRMIIEDRDYDRVIDSYKSLVTKGDLTSAAYKVDDQNGTRLTGSFSSDIKGSAVIFKINDKTLTLRSDAEDFNGDFEALIKTITFNK